MGVGRHGDLTNAGASRSRAAEESFGHQCGMCELDVCLVVGLAAGDALVVVSDGLGVGHPDEFGGCCGVGSCEGAVGAEGDD